VREGKSRREALRCLKRHLARRVWKLLQPSGSPLSAPTNPQPTRPTKTITMHCDTPTGSIALTSSNERKRQALGPTVRSAITRRRPRRPCATPCGCPSRSRSCSPSLLRWTRRSGPPADTPQSGRLPRSYQVTPAILGRRRTTQRPRVRPHVRQRALESVRRRPRSPSPSAGRHPPDHQP
jgi:hypothetical protein